MVLVFFFFAMVLLTQRDFLRSAPNVKVVRISKHARVDGMSDCESHRRLSNVLISALNVKVNEIQTNARNDGSG